MKRTLVLFVFLLAVSDLVAQEVSTTTISIFKKTYEVKFVEVEGETYVNWSDLVSSLPGWFVVTNEGQIEVSAVVQLAVLNEHSGSSSGSSTAFGSVIESNIDGEFSGWDGETLFKLSNGQIWQQSAYAYSYHYAYRPKVTIVKKGSGYIMQVVGMSGTIQVVRIR